MKRIIRIGILAALAVGVAFVAFSQENADDPLDSLKVCKDTQKLIFENQFVRVIDDQIPVGVTEPTHRHRHSVSVFLNTYKNEVTVNGKTQIQARTSGTAQWSEATVHSVKNIGDTPSHAIRIELKF